MKKIKLPNVEIRKNERIWLEAVYDKIKKEEDISYRQLKAQLIDKIPINFNPRSIDFKIATHGGERLTLLGIQLLDAKSNIIEKTNNVIKCIKQAIIDDPKIKNIKSNTVSNITGIEESEVKLIFDLMGMFGQFSSGASRTGKGYGYDTIDLINNRSDYSDMIFNQYFSFESIEKLMDEYYKEEKAKRVKEKSNAVIKKQEIIKANESSLLNINPIFTTRISQIDYKLCFVLMPFTKEWSDRVYKNYIRSNIEDIGLQCLRADNLTGQIIIEDIWTKINQAAFIIADVTDKNPNVMYELGIAHTLGKPVILITQNTSSIPFDFKHLRHYEYQDNSDGKDIFKTKIIEVIKNLYSEFYPTVDVKIS